MSNDDAQNAEENSDQPQIENDENDLYKEFIEIKPLANPGKFCKQCLISDFCVENQEWLKNNSNIIYCVLNYYKIMVNRKCERLKAKQNIISMFSFMFDLCSIDVLCSL